MPLIPEIKKTQKQTKENPGHTCYHTSRSWRELLGPRATHVIVSTNERRGRHKIFCACSKQTLSELHSHIKGFLLLIWSILDSRIGEFVRGYLQEYTDICFGIFESKFLLKIDVYFLSVGRRI